MGPLFPLLFLVFCIIVVVVIALLIKDKKARTTFGISVAVVIGLLVGLMLLQAVLHENPEFVFRDAFDSDPPADVTSLQGEISAAFDLKETWLYFKAHRSTVDYLTRKKGMIEIPQDEALRSRFTNSEGAPSYWQPSISPSGKCYVSGREYTDEILIYNEQEGEVFFRSSRLQ